MVKPTFILVALCDRDSHCDKSSSRDHLCPASVNGLPLLKIMRRCPYEEGG